MIERYKGETPENVVGLEEHKKRPFYKKVSFWVLSALGLFTGSCSVYGLVLGSQYVRAVTEAAHLIADANVSSEEESSTLKKNRAFAYPNNDGVSVVDLGSFTYQDFNSADPNHRQWISTTVLPNVLIPADNSGVLQGVCGSCVVGSQIDVYTHAYPFVVAVRQTGHISVYWEDFVDYGSPNTIKTGLTGKLLYYKNDGNGLGASKTLYDTGYDDGRVDGYDEGYQAAEEEFTNSTEVDFSVAAEMWPQNREFTLRWYLDGNLQETRYVTYQGSNGWSGFTFHREPLQVARLVVEADDFQPFILNYSNRPFDDEHRSPDDLYDENAWDFENSIWYIPSYWTDLYLRINGGSTSQDHNSDVYDIYIDPEHNDRARVGLWVEGYDEGYRDGSVNYGGQYDNGYNAGFEDGRREGVTEGYNRGVQDGTTGGKALLNMFVTAFQQPFNQVYRFLNFNLLGINVLSLFTALLTLSVGIIIIKKVI